MSRSEPDHLDVIVDLWARERPDLDVTALAQVGRLFRLVAVADQALAEALSEYELQPGWFDVLAALRRSGRPFELTPTQLMGLMMVTSGGLTKRLDRLAESGLVERRPDPTDRRGTRVRLTRLGRTTIDRALTQHVRNEQELLSGLTASERRQLDQLVKKLLASLETNDTRT